MMPVAVIKRNIRDPINANQLFLSDSVATDSFTLAVNLVIEFYRLGGSLYIAGNDGSAADTQYLAAEFVSKLARGRDALPAEALTTDSSALASIENDYFFEYIFQSQLAGKMQNNDKFLIITTSGNSENIIGALRQCYSNGVTSIIFSGRGGGRTAAEADCCIIATRDRTSIIQDVQILLTHSL